MEFVSPLTFQTLSANLVVTDTFTAPEYWNVEHVSLAKWADLFVIAPATANILAKISCGIADDMLSTTVLATKAPVLVAPAMNTGMWTAEATKRNVEQLKTRGFFFSGPATGLLACGDEGEGRMSEPEEIVEKIGEILCRTKDYQGIKVLITAGATRERLDPVRFLTNDSSGKMGFALAEAARMRGADVTLVKGNTTAVLPYGLKIVNIESAEDLLRVMKKEAKNHDVIIQAAAVADYTINKPSKKKIKKTAGAPLTIQLTETPDIAKTIGSVKKKGQTFVGFAAETDRVIAHAREKLEAKNLDLIVANDVTKPGAGFNTDTNIVSIVSENGIDHLPIMTKRKVADVILDKIIQIRTK